MIFLKSSEGKIFDVTGSVALKMQNITRMTGNWCDDDCIYLPDVTSKILAKVIEYCERHVDAEDKRKALDTHFVKVDTNMLLELIQAANYLDIKSLLNFMCQIARNTIEGKTPDEIHMILDLVNDLAPEKNGEGSAKMSTSKDVTASQKMIIMKSSDVTASQKMIVLKSSDGKLFEVTEAVALNSQTIKHMIEDNCADNCIPLLNVRSEILTKVIKYCEHYVDAVEKLKSFDADIVKVDLNMLMDLILAARYLGVRSLFNLTCETLRHMKGDKIFILTPNVPVDC